MELYYFDKSKISRDIFLNHNLFMIHSLFMIHQKMIMNQEDIWLIIRKFLTLAPSRDEWIPLFSDIRIDGYHGYLNTMDTWIVGYHG